MTVPNHKTLLVNPNLTLFQFNTVLLPYEKENHNTRQDALRGRKSMGGGIKSDSIIYTPALAASYYQMLLTILISNLSLCGILADFSSPNDLFAPHVISFKLCLFFFPLRFFFSDLWFSFDPFLYMSVLPFCVNS